MDENQGSNKQDSVSYGLEGFREYIRNKIKYNREDLKFDDIQTEASFYSDLKLLCEEYYADLTLNNEDICKQVNNISNQTRELLLKRGSKSYIQDKGKICEQDKTNQIPKALGN